MAKNGYVEKQFAQHSFRYAVDMAGDSYRRPTENGTVSVTRADYDGLNAPDHMDQPVLVLIETSNGIAVAFSVGTLGDLIGRRPGDTGTIAVHARLLDQLAWVSMPRGDFAEGPAPQQPLNRD